MKHFETRHVLKAIAHASTGGQALHVCRSAAFVTSAAPKCFQRSEKFAHLFDQDLARLRATAEKLGVRVIKVERVGQPGQHVDLCGVPLTRAMALAEEQAETERQGALAL